MAKSFTADIGNVQFPERRFTEVSPDTSKSVLAKGIVSTALDVDAKIAESNLIGDERSKTLKVGGLDIPEGAPIQDADAIKLANEVEGELSLRKIKRMRDQGTLSASGAKILAANAVQSASARRPGLAADFRKTASTFFGDFGEGQGVLDASEAEKNLDKEKAHVRMRAIDAGFYVIDPQTGKPVVTPGHLQELQRFNLQGTEQEVTKRRYENSMQAGVVTSAELDSYGRHIAQTATMGVMGRVNAQIARDGTIMKPEQLAQELSLGQTQVASEIDTRIAAQRRAGAIISPSQAQDIHKSAKEQFALTSDFIKSQSFSTIMKDKKSALMDYMTIMGVKAFPTLAMAEAAAPGSSKAVMELTNKIAAMSPNQREQFFLLSPTDRHFWDAYKGAEMMSNSVSNVLNGMFPDKATNPNSYASTMFAATNLAVGTDPKDPSTSTAIDGLIEQVNKGNTDAMHVVASTKVKGNTSPEQKAKFGNSITNASANLVTTVPQVLLDYPNYELVFDGKDFKPALSEEGKKQFSTTGHSTGTRWAIEPGMSGVPADLKRAAKDLNALVRALNNYGGDSSFDSALRSDPYFKEKFGGRSAEGVAHLVLSEINANKRKIEEMRKPIPKKTENQLEAERQKLKEQGLPTE